MKRCRVHELVQSHAFQSESLRKPVLKCRKCGNFYALVQEARP